MFHFDGILFVRDRAHSQLLDMLPVHLGGCCSYMFRDFWGGILCLSSLLQHEECNQPNYDGQSSDSANDSTGNRTRRQS